MRTNNIKIGAYFSHPIQGAKGSACPLEEMALNNDLAALVGGMLAQACPALDLYIPAVHDEFVIESYLRGNIPTEEILEIDKIILARRNIMIAFCYKGVLSNGMRIEIAHAETLGIPIFMFSTITQIPDLVERIVNHYYNTHLT